MSTRRFVFAVIVIAMGTLQAWDSRVFGAPAIVVALATMGILAPAAALLTRDARIRLGAIILSALVLLAARMLSPHPLQTLHLVTLIGALVMFADWRMSNPVEPRG